MFLHVREKEKKFTPTQLEYQEFALAREPKRPIDYLHMLSLKNLGNDYSLRK